MTNIVYLAENIKKVDLFLNDLLFARAGVAYDRSRLLVEFRDIFVYGASITSPRILELPNIDYFIDDVVIDGVYKNDIISYMRYNYDKAIKNIMIKSFPHGKTVTKEYVKYLIDGKIKM
jgi:hypothetical protein